MENVLKNADSIIVTDSSGLIVAMVDSNGVMSYHGYKVMIDNIGNKENVRCSEDGTKAIPGRQTEVYESVKFNPFIED